MSVEDIRLSPEFKFFLTFHFSLGFSIEYSASKEEHLGRLKNIAKILNNSEKFAGYRWSAEEFDKEFPLSLQAKHGYLLGKCDETSEVLPKIKNRFSEYHSEVELASESIREDIVYFDHGVGSVNLLIEGKLRRIEAINDLRNLALNIQRDIQEAADKSLKTDIQGPSLRVFDEWDDFCKTMRLAFENCNALYDIWGIGLLQTAGRGPTRVVGTGALLYRNGNSPLEPSVGPGKRIDLLFDFAGPKSEKPIEETTIDKEGKIYLAQGYDGHIAIVSKDEQETWLTNLWQFITDHYSAVRDLERYLYVWALSLSNEKQPPDYKNVREALEAILRIELSIDILTYESLPYNFAGKGYERKVYEGIYEAWDTEKAIESLNDKFKTLSARFNYFNTLLEEEAQQKSNKIQSWLNILVFILACVTLISVSHDIFAFPYGNAFIKSWTPYILSLLFLFFGCIVFLYVMKESIFSRKNKRK